jgi:ABC-type multidrug transport system ATPase subunit
VLGERGTKISGGERQRIAVARAFLRDAPILILDEPTSSIDSKTETVILDALEKLMEGRTTIMIAHRLSTVRGVDQILVLDQGEIVQRGPHQELVEQEGLYRSLWEAQTRVRGPRRAELQIADDVAAAAANGTNGSVNGATDPPPDAPKWSLEQAALARFSSGHLPRERLNSILGTIRDRLPRGWDRS